ncbi:hypothetical protein GQ457_01G027870 [Hibiscus cannabinus]
MYECARVFTIVNYCKETIWPGITPADNFDAGSIQLKPGRSIVFQAPVEYGVEPVATSSTGSIFRYGSNRSTAKGTAACAVAIWTSGVWVMLESHMIPTRRSCPNELAVNGGGDGKAIGCRSACEVFDTDRHCCRGTYGNSVTCEPTLYSKKLKEACPTAYNYAYDDPSSIFSCAATDYVVGFCLPRFLYPLT